ncbi:cytochrome c maturation protein CcmE [Pelagibius sp.]|uniref:cytochrome c maturation protein CcmE n=1 Tax=Pelagibius sp. TaxID=1931238 RepID=UPI002AC33CC1|nr:cytochrome c maturation protein CcmE [Pelagibius sp.]
MSPGRMTRKRRRLTIVFTALVVFGAATALVLAALDENLDHFRSPSQLIAEPPAPDRGIRLGGLVEEGSVERAADGLSVTFRITDLAESVPVSYVGILPDLFREGQGVVTTGSMQGDGTFAAREVLAKHDENYMPREVVDALKASGQWRHGEEIPQ